MKLSNRQRRSNKIELSMTSMIDVVFLLLIFFLVTTTFLRPEQQLHSAIKVNEKDSAQAKTELEPAIVDVVSRGEKTWFRLGAITTDDISVIENALKLFDNKNEGAFVRVSDHVEFEQAAKAVAVCRSVGFVSVSYLPLRNE